MPSRSGLTNVALKKLENGLAEDESSTRSLNPIISSSVQDQQVLQGLVVYDSIGTTGLVSQAWLDTAPAARKT